MSKENNTPQAAREDFEREYDFLDLTLYPSDLSPSYLNKTTNTLYRGWKAAHAKYSNESSVWELLDKLESLVTPMNMEIKRSVMRKAIAVVREHFEGVGNEGA